MLWLLAGWVAPTLIFARGLFLSFTLFWHDTTITIMPLRDWAMRCLSRGHLPLWCPYVGAGDPTLAQGQGGVFYPTNLLSYLLGLPSWWDYTFQSWLGLGLAGTLFFLWLHRGKRLSPTASFLGGQTFALSGFMVCHVMHLPMLQIAAWLPAALGLAERLARAPGPRTLDVLLLAFVVAMAWLAGHPQTAVYLMVAALVWGWFHADAAARRRYWFAAGLAMALGMALASVQLLPTALQARFSHQRKDDVVAFARELSLTPRSLVNFLHPEFFGSYADGNYFGGDHHYEVCGWAGGAALLLFLPGLLFPLPRLSRTRWACLALIFLGLFFGLARLNPAYELLAYVPRLALFRGAGRLVLLIILGVAVLAATGFDSLRISRGARLTLGLVASLSLACWLVAPVALHAGAPPLRRALRPQALARAHGDAAKAEAKIAQKLAFWQKQVAPDNPYVALWLLLSAVALALSLPALHSGGLLSWAGKTLLLAGAVGHLLLLGYWYNPWHDRPDDLRAGAETRQAVVSWGWEGTGYFYTDPSLPAFATRPRWRPYSAQAVREWVLDYVHSLRPTANELGSVASVANPYPLAPKALWDLTERALPKALAGRGKLARPGQVLRALGVNWVITSPEGAARLEAVESRLLPGGRGEVVARLIEEPASLVWAADEVRFVPDEAAALKELAAPDYSWRRAIIEGPAEEPPSPAPALVQQVSLSPYGQVRLRVRCLGATWLVIAVAYHPGWQASVDGAPVQLWRCNAVMSALPLAAGEHEVKMTFHCPGLYLGALLSLMALTVAVLLLLVAWLRSEPSEPKASSGPSR
ncbi:MAG: YfhO family protein [Armatimonadetes bacterium]|nr:YfhO family protein [Armatimonadota bacterium]